ncbi:MAG: TIGR03364 family FAD-dependent oxidoreductase [Bacteroidota bacterium]
MEKSADIAIVGGGIAGLAHAYMALRKGYRVVLFEREHFAVGASVRNFGLVWPIGQEPEIGLQCAISSRKHWIDLSQKADFWLQKNGSVHLAYQEDEEAVLTEFLDLYKHSGFDCEWLTSDQVVQKSPAVSGKGLRGGVYSSTECIVNPREAIRKIPLYLKEKYGLILRFGRLVHEITHPFLRTQDETWHASQIYVCSGSDFETLYPNLYWQQNLTKCKLQMMKAMPRQSFTLGPSLCAGLTLRHYAAFSKCKSLHALDKRYDELEIGFKEHGVHVLLAQHADGGLIIGDSHHYFKTVEPFDSEAVNQLILKYLSTFLQVEFDIIERWHGVYPKLNGSINLEFEPEPGVTIINGLGGAGMTLSFGIAEEIVGRL